MQWPPTAKKKKNHKSRAIHGQIQGLLVFYQSYSHHLVRWYPLWNPLSRQLYFAGKFGCIFHLGVVLDIEIWGSWSKDEPSEICKDDQKRIKFIYLAILFQIYTGVLSTQKKNWLNVLDTTALRDLLRIREAKYGQSISLISKSTTLHLHLIVLSTFLCHHFTTTACKCRLTLRFIKDVNKRRRTFFLHEFAYIWQNKRLVISNAKKNERMRIHLY